MATDTITALPERKPDWVDDATRILLSARYLRACWHSEILDVDSKDKHDTIIERKDPFEVRFRVYLEGRLWRCISGCWCFNVGFAAIGDGPHFDLSDRLPDKSEFHIRDWKGCDGVVIEKCVTVPGGTIPAGECGTLYEVGSKFELRCCGCCGEPDSHLAVAGREFQGEYMFV